MELLEMAKSPLEYYCEICNFHTSKKNHYERHLQTIKHKKGHTELNEGKKGQKGHFCDKCSKEFKTPSGLWKHKKKCTYNEEENKIITSESNLDIKDMFMKVLEENKELRKTISDIIPLIGNNNNNTINNKNKFNINVFLNEKCKDAISMDQFIDKIEVSMKNLLTTKDKGIGTGISNIIIDNMNKLSLYERPMHCTDKKRETLYIKNEEWEKDEKKQHINNLLKKVEKKQLNSITKWTEEHPNFMENDKLQDEYMHLIKGCTSSMDDCKEKVIKKVCDKIHVPE